MSEIKITQADLTKVLAMRPGQGFHIEAVGVESYRGADPRHVTLTALLRRERDGIAIVNLDKKREPDPQYPGDERVTSPSPSTSVTTTPSTPETKAAARNAMRPPAKPPGPVAPPIAGDI